ncbi:MAG: S4 domain-containing protein [Terriglobales bacterium]
MKLDKILVTEKLARSRTEAQRLIRQGQWELAANDQG